MEDDNRNLIVFGVCAALLMLLYNFVVMAPAEKRRAQLQQQAQATASQMHQPTSPSEAAAIQHASAFATTARVPIDTPSLTGSIALTGARIDDLSLKAYHVEPSPKSPLIRLLRPEDQDHPWFAVMSYDAGGAPVKAPGLDTVWTAQPGAKLTPQTPLQLTYDAGQGLIFHRTIAVDQNYMFTVTDAITNAAGGQPVTLAAYNAVIQRGLPADPSTSGIVFEGAIGQLDGKLALARYKCGFGMLFCEDWTKKPDIEGTSIGGWLGLTQKYWLTALIPDQSTAIRSEYRINSPTNEPGKADSIYEVGYHGPQQTIAPGASVTETSRLFAGAKVVPLLQAYGTALHIPAFDNAVDWGIYWFFTHPLFTVLSFFRVHLGSFALALLSLTVCVRLLLFPLANKGFESTTKMRKLQPQVEALKKKFPDDPAQQQKEMAQLYQRENVNLFVGCLPVLIQIPLMYSLYKVLTVTIEMRQAPFFGWIKDMSARDPTTLWNLFGILPWDPSKAPYLGHLFDTNLHIGVWPLIYGFSMWLTQSMNPPSPDPAQQRIFALMPLIFTFTLSQFTVGLLIYWSWSTLLTVLQQYVMMHRFGVSNPIDDLVGRFIKPKAAG